MVLPKSYGIARGWPMGPGQVSGGTPTPPPTPELYLLDANYGTSTFRYKAIDYNTEAAFLTAIGGTQSGVKRTIGDYVSPTSPELIPDPTVATGDGWSVASATSGQPGLTGAAVAGEYVLTAASANSQPYGGVRFPVQEGKSYRVKGKVRKEASASVNSRFAVTADPAVANGLIVGTGLLSNQATLSPEQIRTFGAIPGYELPMVGVNGNSSTFTGGLAADDLSAKENIPFDGWTSGQVSGIVEGVTPSAATGVDQIIWQSDDDGRDGGTIRERNYIRLCYDSTGRLRLRVFCQTAPGTTGVQQANIDLGAVAISTTFKVQFVATFGQAGASLNDANAVTASVTRFPGLSFMRIGGGQVATTNDWGGTVTRVRIFNDLVAPPGMSLSSIYMTGDSYGAGFAGAVTTATGAAVKNTSVGGATIAQELGYIQGTPPKAGQVTVFWDGAANGSSTSADWLSVFDQIAVVAGGVTRIIAMPPLKRASNQAEAAMYDQIAAGLASRLGANFIDAQAILASHGDGSTADNAAIAAGYCPPSLMQPDGVHINDTARGYVAAAVATRWNVIK